jgi:hypothetical protein
MSTPAAESVVEFNDTFTFVGATRLASIIKQYWHDKGNLDVEVDVEIDRFRCYVRSNLIGGLPPSIYYTIKRCRRLSTEPAVKPVVEEKPVIDVVPEYCGLSKPLI